MMMMGTPGNRRPSVHHRYSGLPFLPSGRQSGRFRPVRTAWPPQGCLAAPRSPTSPGAISQRPSAPLAAELKSRQESTSEDQAPIYIIIFDIQRFRDLRKSDDDFGYTRYDEDKPQPPLPSFSATSSRVGPPSEFIRILWCDSVNNMNRTLDRQGMKEFENRILFQMSANDSSTLIDTPAASKLGEKRALYLQRGKEQGSKSSDRTAFPSWRGSTTVEARKIHRAPASRGQWPPRKRQQRHVATRRVARAGAIACGGRRAAGRQPVEPPVEAL